MSAVPDATISDPPTSPSTAMERGTSRDRSRRPASRRLLTPRTKLGPTWNAQS
jgi:hypothetical protein